MRRSTRFRLTGRDGSAGTAAIEFAFIAPILVILLIGVADYAIMASRAASLAAAARAGAGYARVNPADSGGAQSAVTGFMTFSPSVTAGVTVFCQCMSDAPTVQRTCPTTPAANPCVGDASGNTLVMKFISVSASQAFSPLLAFASFAFPATLSRAATLRIQ